MHFKRNKTRIHSVFVQFHNRSSSNNGIFHKSTAGAHHGEDVVLQFMRKSSSPFAVGGEENLASVFNDKFIHFLGQTPREKALE